MHLYLHIPYCRTRCAYCDFCTYAGMETSIEPYVTALCHELQMLPHPETLYASAWLRPSIFLGGGTPAILSLNQLERLLHIADSLIPLQHAEISLEANPGAVMGIGKNTAPTYRYFQGLQHLGINRLSLGVQSLHNPTLRVLGRIHTKEEAYACFEQARRAGFENINLDLMYGVPGQTRKTWSTTLDSIISWEPDHLALYALTLEAHTPLYACVARGDISLPDEDETAAMYEMAIEQLANAGYIQYEISNWARKAERQPQPHTTHKTPCLPSNVCHHNIAYWLNDDYLGAGAAAHGHVFPHRYANTPDIATYIAAVQRGERPLNEEILLSKHDLYAETMFMGLRLNTGVPLAHFRQRCQTDLHQVYGETLAALESEGLLEQSSSTVRLTHHGRMLGNRVFERFLL